MSEQPELTLEIAAEAVTGRELVGEVPDDARSLPGQRRRRMRQVKYWRRPKRGTRFDGWIVVGPTRRNPYEWESMVSSGFEELPDHYGVEVINQGDISDVLNEHRRFVPLIKNGGLKEMPASQIVALGWHKIEAIRRIMTVEQRREVDEIVRNAVHCEYGCVEQDGSPLEFYHPEDLARHNAVEHASAQATTGAVRAMEKSLETALRTVAEVDEQRLYAVLRSVMSTLMDMAANKATIGEVEQKASELIEKEKEGRNAAVKR